MSSLSRPPPQDRSGFKVAILCILKTEFNAVEGVFDQYWGSDHQYGKAEGDPNAYATGRIGDHDVVLAFLPDKGNVSSATVASNLRFSFSGIRLCLVVGVCGGSPFGLDNKQEIIMGDVIISTGIVQVYPRRHEYDDIHIKNTLGDSLGGPYTEIGIFLNQLSGIRGTSQIQEDTWVYLSQLLQEKGFEEYQYLGADKDRLYEATYRHKHHMPTDCSMCSKWTNYRDPVCSDSKKSTCAELQCDEDKLIRRTRLRDGNTVKPLIHLGIMASSNQVKKSGVLREKILKERNAIGFEMEGAGAWDNFPTVVIKGVCDYADSHKAKGWQKYASATAAACMKAFLRQWSVVDQPHNVQSGPVQPAFCGYCLNQTDSGQLDVSLEHLQMFRTQNYEDQKSRNPRPASGSFQGFLKSPTYLNWLSNDDSDLLWLSADRGNGKSMLARKLVDDFYEQGYFPCYFFFKSGGDENQDSAAAALCAILHQLFCRQRELLEYASKYIEENGSKLCTLFQPLWDILTKIACQSSIGTVICVIDGIDECKDSDRSMLIRELQEFHSRRRNKPQTGVVFKFLVTRRPCISVNKQFHDPIEDFCEILLGEEDAIEGVRR